MAAHKKRRPGYSKGKRWQMCERKIRHATKEQALYHIELLSITRGIARKKLRFYHCPICHGYHISSHARNRA